MHSIIILENYSEHLQFYLKKTEIIMKLRLFN